MDRFDYVIVGAGSAGCVLTSRLSEDPATSVCVLEAGPSDWYPWIHIPAGMLKLIYNPRVNWNYLTDPDDEPDLSKWHTELAFRLAE
jgi:choline dehydrogenase